MLCTATPYAIPDALPAMSLKSTHNTLEDECECKKQVEREATPLNRALSL